MTTWPRPAACADRLGALPPQPECTSTDRADTLRAVAGIGAELAGRAQSAQRLFENWPEPRVDAVLADIAQAVDASSQLLAEETVAETGFGNAADKAAKNRFASTAVYRHLAGRPAAGVLGRDPVTGITEIATPVGVILGILPVTNPVATLVFKTLISLKARNALIASPHHAAEGVCGHAGHLIRQVLERHGAPQDLLQCVPRAGGRALVQELMRSPQVALVLATGGAGIARAASSCDTPAIAVGAGNAPAWIRADADLTAAAHTVVASKSFDYGLICGSEQHLVVDGNLADSFRASLVQADAAILTEIECQRLAASLFDPVTGTVRREAIGRSPAMLAQMARLTVPPNTRLLVVPLDATQVPGRWSRERLAPVVTLISAANDDHAVALCRALLAEQGHGHTAAIHTRDPAMVHWFGRRVPVNRLIVNGPAAQGSIGLGTGLAPSFTLGCGTVGGTSTSENVDYHHLLNICRAVEQVPPVPKSASSGLVAP